MNSFELDLEIVARARTVPHSLTFGRARGGAYWSEQHPAPITWHMSARPEQACSTAARFDRRPITARYITACFPHTQHLSNFTTARHTHKNVHTHTKIAHKHKNSKHTSQARRLRTSGPTKLAPVSCLHCRADHSCTLLKQPRARAHFCREQHDPVTCPPLCNTTFLGHPHPLRPLPCCRIARRTDDGILNARIACHSRSLPCWMCRLCEGVQLPLQAL